jgi:cyclopropane fatty-acyl-phospholipid synthase-like methyltransferase
MKVSMNAKKYTCRICENNDCKVALKLVDTPFEDQFLQKKMPQSVFPLEILLCEPCGYLYLSHLVSPEESYTEYMYNSSITVGLSAHYDEYAKELVSRFGIEKDSLIVDLGSNDGSMLSSLQKCGMRAVGVEPAALIALNANNKGLNTICGFFDENIAKNIINQYGTASAVTANYMFANIDNLKEFCRNANSLLDEDGLFIIQTGYHLEQLNSLMFDYVYHEHYSYFSVRAIKKLLELTGFKLLEIKKTTPKGGSIRVIAQKSTGLRPQSDEVAKILAEEELAGIYRLDFYAEIKNRMDIAQSDLRLYLDELKLKNIKIIGFGASHSTTTLLYSFGLHHYLDYIVDDNPAKFNTFTPGIHIPVFSTERLKQETSPFSILVLAWQHAETIIKKHSLSLQEQCEFIVPLPKLIIKKFR